MSLLLGVEEIRKAKAEAMGIHSSRCNVEDCDRAIANKASINALFWVIDTGRWNISSDVKIFLKGIAKELNNIGLDYLEKK